MSNSSNSRGGISFFTVLFLVFLILKLTHTINWSWWLITIPLWGGVVLAIIMLIVVAIIAVIIKDI